MSLKITHQPRMNKRKNKQTKKAASLLINSVGQRPMRNDAPNNYQAESLTSKRLCPFRARVLLHILFRRALPYAIDCKAFSLMSKRCV